MSVIKLFMHFNLGGCPQKPDANGHVTLPSNATSIGQEAYFYCPSLKSITIPISVVFIGVKAFQSTLLTASYFFNTVLGANAFSDYTIVTIIGILIPFIFQVQEV